MNAKNKAVAGLVLSIVGVACSLLSGVFAVLALFGLPCSIVGLVLSVIGGKGMQACGMPKGMATAGLVIGIVGTALGAITFFTCGLCVLCVGAAGNAIENAAEDAIRDSVYGW